MKIEEEVSKVRSDLDGCTDQKRKEMSVGYYPSSMEIMGVKVPDQRKVTNSLRKRIKGSSPEDVLYLAKALVDTNVFECQQVAYEMLSKDRKALALIGLRELVELGKGLDNWVSVDTYSGYLSGVAWREGRVSDDVIRGWARSEDRWIRRCALVSTIALNQKARGGTGDVERTLMICEMLYSDKDDMVAKALSWALRELSKIEREPVIEFMKEHGAELTSRVRREVKKKLETGKKNR
ncbi:MAG: DNA alkylation repair protein [Candidatus Thermoplasmatota archaeon]|nr:DNA alkylation repair protein [Candidatus Thermoplasmatota archaeon]